MHNETLKDITGRPIAIIKHEGSKQSFYDMTGRKLAYYDGTYTYNKTGRRIGYGNFLVLYIKDEIKL